MYVKLKNASEEHEFIKEKSNVSPPIKRNTAKEKLTPVLLCASKDMTAFTLSELNLYLKQCTIQAMKHDKVEFEGVMIDNGAAKSPSGLPAFIRYCAHAGFTPKLRQSSKIFRVLGMELIARSERLI